MRQLELEGVSRRGKCRRLTAARPNVLPSMRATPPPRRADTRSAGDDAGEDRAHPKRTVHAASVGVVLPLDDPRWYELAHRNWVNGSPAGEPDAPFVAEVLAGVYEAPDDAESLARVSPYLCSEGTTYAAAYAAIPHLVRLAANFFPHSTAQTQLLF